VAVELLASSEGLGYLMVWGRQLFQLDMVIAAMLVVGLIGFALDWTLSRVERRLQRWELAGS
jgi:sulfonate transport system permease protein